MAFAAMSGSRPAAEINITPLVDVMLVLLIIFMVTAPMLSGTLPLSIAAGREQPQDSEPLTLRIERDGSVLWNSQRLPAGVVEAALRAEAGRAVAPLLQIEADPEADYALIAHWLSRARHHGHERIAL